MLRLALIGCGRIAQLVHLRALAGLPECRVIAVADPDAERLQEAVVRAPEARAFADYRDLLAARLADAVVIAAPPKLHAEVATTAFAAGLHVYLEKPGATSRGEAEAVLDAWRRAGTVGMVGFNQRFHPMYGALKRALRRERLGDIVGVRSVFSAAPRGLPPWKQRRATGGGVVLDLAVHHVDLLRFLFDDEVAEVSAMMRSLRSENDAAVLSLRLERGPIAQVFVSMTTSAQDSFEVYGTAGRLTADRYGSGKLEFSPTQRVRGRVARAVTLGTTAAEQVRELVRPTRDTSHVAALQAFAAAVRGQPPERLPTPDDAFRSLGVVFDAEHTVGNAPWTALAAQHPTTPLRS